jgi:hypothetical protein
MMPYRRVTIPFRVTCCSHFHDNLNTHQMLTTGSYDTSVFNYQTSQRHIPDSLLLHPLLQCPTERRLASLWSSQSHPQRRTPEGGPRPTALPAYTISSGLLPVPSRRSWQRQNHTNLQPPTGALTTVPTPNHRTTTASCHPLFRHTICSRWISRLT